LADRNLFAITSFIIGMDNDTVGVAERTLEQIRSWPPGLPVFGQLTPFPATPLYDRLKKDGRLTRPTHWLDFTPYQMAHTPLKMTIAEAQIELQHAWESSYSPQRNAEAIKALSHKGVGWKIYHLIMRLSFRGIYFPQMGILSWCKVLKDNRQTIFQLMKETWLAVRKKGTPQRTNSHPQRAVNSSNSHDQATSSVEPSPKVMQCRRRGL
jgi:hypothetical protein